MVTELAPGSLTEGEANKSARKGFQSKRGNGTITHEKEMNLAELVKLECDENRKSKINRQSITCGVCFPLELDIISYKNTGSSKTAN